MDVLHTQQRPHHRTAAKGNANAKRTRAWDGKQLIHALELIMLCMLLQGQVLQWQPQEDE